MHRRLLHKLEEWAREMSYEYIILSTLQSMTAAVSFYVNNGFSQIDALQVDGVGIDLPGVKFTVAFLLKKLT